MKKEIGIAILCGLMPLAASAVSITDPVESGDGWSQIQPANAYNSYQESAGGLTPESGTKFWKSGFPNNNNFGTYKEFDATFTAGVLRVTYSIGDLDSNTWPGEIGSRLFIASDGEGNFGSTWLNRVEPTTKNRPTPNDGEWVTCTDTYVIDSTTTDAAGNPVIGEKIGFAVVKKLSGGSGTGGQAYAFDNLTIQRVGGYDGWATGYGLTNGPSGDDDADGILNLYEYGMGGNPTNGSIDGNIPSFGNDGGGLHYVYARRTDDTDLVYYLETTESLSPPIWTNMGYTAVATNITGDTFDFVTNSIETVTDAKFIRLIIE